MIPIFQTKIQNAIEKKSLNVLKEAFKEPDAHVNARFNDGRTALHQAVSERWVEGIEFLLSRPGIDVNLPETVKRNTPLHFATDLSLHFNDSYDALALLLRCKDVNVNATNEDNNTALLRAMEQDQKYAIPAVQLILTHPKLDLDSTEVHRLLFFAIGSGNVPILHILLSDPRIHKTFQNFSNDKIKTLWDLSVINSGPWTQEIIAYRALTSLFKQKSDLTLEEAETVLPEFLEKEFAQKAFESSKLIANCPEDLMFCFGFPGVVELSKHKGALLASTNAQRDITFADYAETLFPDALFRAIDLFYLAAHFPFFECLLNSTKIDVNQKNALDEETALHIAVRQGKIFLVQRLLEHPNIEPSLANKKGETPLHIAMMGNHLEIISLLLKHPKTEINAQDHDGNTPAHRLLKENRIPRHARLVEKTAHLIFKHPHVNLELQNKTGESLLKHVLDKDSIVLVKLLIDCGALTTPEQWKVKGKDMLPPPNIYPQAFALLLKGSPQIKIYYAALSILRKNKSLTREKVFETLAVEQFPGHERWSEEDKDIAFRHAQSVALLPESLFALVIFFSDGLLQLKNLEKDAENANQDTADLNQDTESVHQHVVDLSQNETDLEIDAADSEINSVVASNARRFLTIAQKLPIEMQMKLCHAAFGNSKTVIPAQDSEVAFKLLAAKCVP